MNAVLWNVQLQLNLIMWIILTPHVDYQHELIEWEVAPGEERAMSHASCKLISAKTPLVTINALLSLYKLA